MTPIDEIVSYTDFARDADGNVWGTAHRKSGKTERTKVKITVDREIARGGHVIASGQVASSDVPAGDVGAVKVAA